MIINKKGTIDDLVEEAKDVLGIYIPEIAVAADTKYVYDVRISLDIKKPTPPHLIALSYDKDAGYFVDIDSVTWEFQDNDKLFQSEVIRLLKAIRNNKVKIIRKRFLGIITTGYEAYITEGFEG